MYSTWGLLVLTCGPVFAAAVVICFLLRFAEKDASWLSFLTSVAGVTIAISVVAVMPYDVWRAVAVQDAATDPLLRRSWAATYWATMLLSYVLCPILMEFESSGDFTVAARLRTSLRRNAVFYAAYGLIMVILLIILIVRGEVQGDVQSWCIAASNAWGIFVLTVLMGFGLVAVPRHFWSLAKPESLLQDLYRNAVVKDEIRLSRLFELQDTVAQARAELASEADAGDVLGAACATLSHMADRCESLHMELSGTRIREKSGGLPRPASGNLTLPAPSLTRFAEVHRSLKAAALEARRASCCFDSHIQRCIFFEDLEQGDHRAAVHMLGRRMSLGASPTGLKFRRTVLTFWLRHVRARALMGLGYASTFLSAVVVLGQLTLFADGWHLSLLSLFFRQDYGPWITQALCVVPLAYMTYTAYFSGSESGELVCTRLQDLKVFSDSFNEPLSVARECMSQVDADLLAALNLTQSQANDLIASAQMVTWKLSATACNSLELLPTLLWAARGHGEERDVVSPVSEVHSSITAMRKEAQTVRTSYIELLNQVRYLGQCTQVTLDQIIIASLPVGDFEVKPVKSSHKTVQTHSEKCLELALVHLDGVCMTLEECSDFWLMLHSAELQLRKIEKEAQQVSSARLDAEGATMHSFCERLRDFCKEHCGVPPVSFPIVNPLAGIGLQAGSTNILRNLLAAFLRAATLPTAKVSDRVVA
ncbi:unnamed protein product [Effrenium voratum]|uniref:Uncharacterized protein n=1 Tax=Effrenium voratum TaxID=2562239 RepID=A0AA36JR79_9DINO|nr:unnamed protein product [Effrenium voratum]